MKASQGQRNPTAAGIRMGNTKFMLTRHDPEEQTGYLSRAGGGGACIIRIKNALVIGIWDKNTITSNNQPQTMGQCNMLTEATAKLLKDQGY